MKKYSTKEENVVLSSQLYLLEKQHTIDSGTIKAIGDLLPGVVIINDMLKLENTYMNAVGCEFLDKSREQIQQLGSSYFSVDHFCMDEMLWIAQHFGALAERDDNDEVIGFYQRVRRNKNADWNQYYLSGKIMGEEKGSFIYLGLQVDQRARSIQKMSKILDINPIVPTTFERFNSLTKREKQILKLISSGYSNKQISDLLFIAQFTVETHRKNINAKLGTKTLSDLIRISDLFSV